MTKYTTSARGLLPEPHAAPGSSKQDINIRDAFVASPGCLLIAADYSQIELRVLAHLSGDLKLIEILKQAGVGGDAFALIAKTWLRKPHDTGHTYLGFFASHLTLLILQPPQELSLSSAITHLPSSMPLSQPFWWLYVCWPFLGWKHSIYIMLFYVVAETDPRVLFVTCRQGGGVRGA